MLKTKFWKNELNQITFGNMDYMVTYQLPKAADEHFFKTIPVHREKIHQLIEAGVIKTYNLSVGRDVLWMVVEAMNTNDLENILNSLPLHEYLSNYSIEPLLFSLNANSEMPHISLN